jgi:hypothetical protein
MRPEGLSQLKNLKDPIENRTRDLPACNAVPQPTDPRRMGLVKILSTKTHATFRLSNTSTYPQAISPQTITNPSAADFPAFSRKVLPSKPCQAANILNYTFFVIFLSPST